MVGGLYKALELDDKRAIDMGTRMALEIHERGEVTNKPGKHIFIPKVGTEDCMMHFLKTYVGGKNY